MLPIFETHVFTEKLTRLQQFGLPHTDGGLMSTNQSLLQIRRKFQHFPIAGEKDGKHTENDPSHHHIDLIRDIFRYNDLGAILIITPIIGRLHPYDIFFWNTPYATRRPNIYRIWPTLYSQVPTKVWEGSARDRSKRKRRARAFRLPGPYWGG